MQKAALMVALLAALSAEAFADTANSNSSSGAVSNSGSSSFGNVGNQTTNNMTPTAGAASNASNTAASTSSNNGNTQVIQFITPTTSTTPTPQAAQAVDANGQPLTSNARVEEAVSYSGSYTIKNVPSVNGPPLTTSNDTCMGSSSGSINGAGFGIGLGSTWTDRNCVLLKNARELWNMGMKAAAMALMCNDANNRVALEITGFACPQTVAARQAEAEAQKQAQVQRENELLKARLAALESERAGKAQPVKASTSWFGRRSNPSAEAMLPPPVVPAVADQPAPIEPRPQARVQEAPVPAAAVEAKQEAPAAQQDARVEVTPIPDANVQSTTETAQATIVRVVSEPRQ